MSMKMLVPMEVGICCVDLPALSRFYQNVLGFTFVAQVHMPAAAAQQVSAQVVIVDALHNHDHRRCFDG